MTETTNFLWLITHTTLTNSRIFKNSLTLGSEGQENIKYIKDSSIISKSSCIHYRQMKLICWLIISFNERCSYPVHKMKSKSSPLTCLMNWAADLTSDMGASHLKHMIYTDCDHLAPPLLKIDSTVWFSTTLASLTLEENCKNRTFTWNCKETNEWVHSKLMQLLISSNLNH